MNSDVLPLVSKCISKSFILGLRACNTEVIFLLGTSILNDVSALAWTSLIIALHGPRESVVFSYETQRVFLVGYGVVVSVPVVEAEVTETVFKEVLRSKMDYFFNGPVSQVRVTNSDVTT